MGEGHLVGFPSSKAKGRTPSVALYMNIGRGAPQLQTSTRINYLNYELEYVNYYYEDYYALSALIKKI